MNFNDREVVLRAELDRPNDADCVATPLRFLMSGPRAPRPGEEVMLVDVDRGVTCIGTVVSVAGWEAAVRPDWATWSERATRGASSGPAAYGMNTPWRRNGRASASST